MDILIDNERMKSIIEFWQKKCADAEAKNAELKAENAVIKTSYINFITKLKREMITKDDIQDLKNTVKKFVEERNSLILENERLKEENFNFEEIVKLCRCEQYKQTLQEIKAAAEMNICSNCVIHKRECNCQCLADEILQKITKAEEE